MVGVEERDDDDREQVVDDGEREQEGPQRRRQERAQDGQDGQRERDVRRRGDGPATQCGAARAEVDGDEDQCRNDHASDGSDDRDRRSARVAQVAGDELTLQLEAGDEEEDGQQTVGSPRAEGQVEVQRLRADPGVTQRRVGVAEAAVGEHDRERGGGEQEEAADGLLSQQRGDARGLWP